MRPMLKIKNVIKNFVFFVIEMMAHFFVKKRSIDKAKIKKILIIEGGGLGDLLRVFPVIEAFQANFPGASISLLASPSGQGVLSLFPHKGFISEVLDYSATGRRFFEKVALVRTLRKKHFDLSYSPSRGEGMRELILISFFTGAPHRMGFRKGGVGLLNTVGIEFRDAVPILLQNLAILKAADLVVESEEIKLDVPESDMTYAKRLLSENVFPDLHPLITIHPGASWNARYRCWPLDNYISLINILLREMRARVFLIGNKDEIEISEKILGAIQDPRLVSMTGKMTLSQTAAVIRLSHLFIGSDSGPMHIAAGMNVPFIGLFGPTAPGQVLSNTSKGIILNKTLSCAPCYLHQPIFEPPCNAVGTPKCMETISVEDVIKAVRKIMPESKTKD